METAKKKKNGQSWKKIGMWKRKMKKKICAEHKHSSLREAGGLPHRGQGDRRGWWKYRLLQSSEGRTLRGLDWTVDTLSAKCEEGWCRVQTPMKQKKSMQRLSVHPGYISHLSLILLWFHSPGHPERPQLRSFLPPHNLVLLPTSTASSLGGAQLDNLHPPTHQRDHYICLQLAASSEAP